MARRSVPLTRLQGLLPSARGLTAGEAEARRQEYGSNAIVEAPPHPWWDLLRDTAKDPMLWFFAGVGVLYLVIGQRTEALTLLVAILPLLGVCPSIAFRPRPSNNPQTLPAIDSGRLRGWHDQDVSRLVQ